MANEVIRNDFSPTLTWVTGTGTTNVQICKNQDFATGTLFAGTTAGTSLSPDLTSMGSGKFYWRWQKTTDGTNFDVFREINSFIVNSAFYGDVALANDKWIMISTGTSVVDSYVFEVNPLDWEITEEHVKTQQNRNLKGKLRSEWVNQKASISLDFTAQSYIGTAAKAEFQRFYNMHDSFYVAKRFEAQDGANFLYKAWEVEFKSPLQMERVGGLTLDLEEV